MSNHTPVVQPHPNTGKRNTFRALGLLAMAGALALGAVALADFFRAFDDPSFDAAPTKFWMFFLAVPLFAVGGFLLNLGFGGVHATYLADEYSPAMRTVATDLGLRDAGTGRGAEAAAAGGPYCRSCGTRNDAEARFCDHCGTSTST